MADPIVIIGAGVAGGRAAMELREHGWNGAVTLVGGEPLPPYDRPPLSKSAITDGSVPEPATVWDVAALANAGINFLPGTTVTRLDTTEHEIVLADTRKLSYGRLLLAVGALSRRLAVSGGDVALSLRTYADAMAIRRTLTTGAHVVIVGGGLIGLELAASAVRLDCSVTVIELAPTLMSRAVSKDIASIVASRHIDAGVRIVPGVGVRHIERRGRLFGIVLSNGEILRADAVIAAVGASPNTALAHAAGIAIDNGIRVDAYLRTSEPDIFAAGDCCSIPHPLFDGRRIRSEAWRSAIDQGAHAARNMLGADQVYDAVPWFWSDQYDLGIQVAGLADAASSVVVREAPNGGQIHYGLDGAGRLVSASGFGRGNAAAKDVRLGELLIRQRATPALTELSDPTFNLKRLLAAKVQEFA